MATPRDIVNVAELGILPSNSPEKNSANAKEAQEGLMLREGQRWLLERGIYRFSEPLTLIRPISLEGATGSFSQPQARLLFPDGSDGVVFVSGGGEAINLSVESDGKTKEIGHGIIVKARVHLADIFVSNFRGDAIRILTYLHATNANSFSVERSQFANCGETLKVISIQFIEVTKSNLGAFEITTAVDHRFRIGDLVYLNSPYWLPERFPYSPDYGGRRGKPFIFHCGIYRVTQLVSDQKIIANFTEGTDFLPGGQEEKFYLANPTSSEPYSITTGHGMLVKGDDSNAGIVTGCVFTNNAGWGILEESFLGDTYTGCLTEANQLGAYRSRNLTPFNQFIGCYSEGGQPFSIILPGTKVIGGDHAAGIVKIFKL